MQPIFKILKNWILKEEFASILEIKTIYWWDQPITFRDVVIMFVSDGNSLLTTLEATLLTDIRKFLANIQYHVSLACIDFTK